MRSKLGSKFHIISVRDPRLRFLVWGFYRYSFLGLFWRRHALSQTELRRLHTWLRQGAEPVFTQPPASDSTGDTTLVRAAIIEFLNEWKPRIKGHVLDVGVGTWTYCRELFSGLCSYTSTDCFEHPNIDVVSDIHNLTAVFEPESYDFVICTDVLEHVARPWEAIRQIYLVLKPGGRLLLTTPFNYPLHGYQAHGSKGDVQVKDYWRLTEDGLCLLLADFSEVCVEKRGLANFPDCYMVVGEK